MMGTNERLDLVNQRIDHLDDKFEREEELRDQQLVTFLGQQSRIIAQLDELTKQDSGICWKHGERLTLVESDIIKIGSDHVKLEERVVVVEKIPEKLTAIVWKVIVGSASATGFMVLLLIKVVDMIDHYWK